MRILFGYLFIVSVILTSCSSGQEVAMPFINEFYSGERLFPVEKNNSQDIFRAWINFGTSIERVITISYDSIHGYQGFLLQHGFKIKNGLIKMKANKTLNEKTVKPKSGFENFFNQLDTLNLMSYENQSEFPLKLDHQPFSLYVIEFKHHNIYNQFVFRTRMHEQVQASDEKYYKLQKIILEEFDFDIH